MKAPNVVIIAILVVILGFLLVYSLKHDMPTTASQGHGAAGGYGAAPAAGGYGAAPAAGGYGAPAAGGYGAPAKGPGAPAGGYGAPPVGSRGK